MQRIVGEQLAQQQVKQAELEGLLKLKPQQDIPAEFNVQDVPRPDTADPFAPKPLRKLADIVAEYYYPPPASALTNVETVTTAVEQQAHQSTERGEADQQYKRSVYDWCRDCDVLKLQLEDGVQRITSGLPPTRRMGNCYECACEQLGIAALTVEDEGGREQDSVASGGVDEKKQEQSGAQV